MPLATTKPPSLEEWEAHKPTLQRLRHEGMTLEDIIKHMESEYKFVASKNQYQRKFKEPHWNFTKNVNSTSWEYILCKVAKRRRFEKPTEVTLFGQEVPEKKIKKARYQFTVIELERIQNLSPAPPTPEGISVRTPAEALRNMEGSLVVVTTPGPVVSIRTVPEEDLAKDIEDNTIVFLSNDPYNEIQSNGALCLIKRRQIPYLQCLDLFDLLDLKRTPQALFRPDFFDAMWSDLWDPLKSFDCLDTEYEANLLWVDTPLETSVQLSNERRNTQIICSFAPLLVSNNVNFLDGPIEDALDQLNRIEQRLPEMLANIPERKPGERDLTIDTLLGPPQPSAGLYLIEVIIYLCSNSLLYGPTLKYNQAMHWIVDNVPLQSMGTLLQNDSPTLQAFRFQLLRFGVQTGRESFVQDLLHIDNGLKDFALRSTQLLSEVVKSNNVEMMKLLLKLGLDVLRSEKFESTKRRLLRDCTSISMSKLLSKEGAVLVSKDSSVKSIGDSALLSAILRRDIEMVQFLINAGANVNVFVKDGWGNHKAFFDDDDWSKDLVDERWGTVTEPCGT